MFLIQRDTCMDQLNIVSDKETMEECEKFVNMTRESMCNKSLEHQRLKFERFCQTHNGGYSNIQHGDHVNHSTTRPNETASDSNSFSQNNI